MPLITGWVAANSLPCCGSSMAMFTVPLLVSPAVATAPPLAAAPLGAALEPLLLHAANARTLTAASAPILCSFIQYLLQITGRTHLAVDPRRGSEPDPRRPEPGGAGHPLGRPRKPGTGA